MSFQGFRNWSEKHEFAVNTWCFFQLPVHPREFVRYSGLNRVNGDAGLTQGGSCLPEGTAWRNYLQDRAQAKPFDISPHRFGIGQEKLFLASSRVKEVYWDNIAAFVLNRNRLDLEV